MTTDAKAGRMQKLGFRILLFIGVFLILFTPTLWLFSNHPDHRVYQMIGGFYEEPENSLDGVYVGSSNCYAFWNPLIAWNNYGLAIFPYSSGSQPFYATEYIMREVRKTQPNAVFIVNLNGVEADDLGIAAIHNLVNYMPDSENRDALINYLCDLIGYSKIEQLEFRIPWIRAREHWLDYIKNGFFPKPDGLKGASRYREYLITSTNISASYVVTDVKADIPEELVGCIDHLLDYCDEEEINVLFVSVPRAEMSENALGRINAVCALIQERGYEVLYLTDKADEIGLDLTQDYYNEKHTNIHGSIKFTNYLAGYLVENYGFESKQGDALYGSWDAAWNVYAKGVSPVIQDIELDASHRDYSLAAPEMLHVGLDENNDISLEWNAPVGADGYLVYRKEGYYSPWEAVSVFQLQTCYKDTDCHQGTEYYYTVVPVRIIKGEKYYGNFLYNGVSITR